MPDEPFSLSLRERRVGRTTVVELSGEVDILAAPQVTVVLDRLTSVPHPDLLVDLRPVTFIDCSGLNTLNRARTRAQARARRFGLLVDDPRVLQVLRLTRLARLFELYSGTDEALTR